MRSNHYSLIFLTLLIWSLCAAQVSAHTLWRCTEFRTGRDMIESKVQCALQDHDGMLWFGTNVGLCRYDGQEFQYFMSTPENNYPLTSNYVIEICEQHSCPGYLWVVTLNQQVYRFCVKTSEYEAMLPLLKVADWVKPVSRRPQRVLYPMDRNEAMWVVLSDGSCARYSYRNPAENKVWTLNEQGESRTLYNIFEDSKGREWLLTDRGPRIYGKGAIGDYPFSMIGERGDTIFLASRNGYYATYTEQGGLSFHDEPDSLLLLSRQAQADKFTLPADSMFVQGDPLPAERIRDVLVDNQGNRWMMGETSLYRLTAQNNPTQFFRLPVKDNVSALVREDADHLLVGMSRHCMVGRLSLSNGHWQYLTPSGRWSETPEPFAKGGIRSLYYTKDSTLWVGTWRDGLYHIDRHQVEHYVEGDSLSLNCNNIRSLYEDENHRLWIGTWGGGLNVFNLANKSRGFYHRGNRLLGYPGNDFNNVNSISGDRKGRIMVGTTRGLLTFGSDVKRQAEIRYYVHTRQPQNPYSLPVNPVPETFFDQNGTPFVCTYGFNVSRVDPESLLSDSTRFYTCYNHDFPEANTVLSGTIDKNGDVWTTNEGGMQRYHLSSGCLEVYRRNDFGMELRLTDCSMQASSDGLMFVGAEGGVLSFHCDSLSKTGFRPQVVFTDVKVDGSRKVQLHMASLDYRPNSTSVHFGYWLEGFDEDWHFTDDPDIAFTNLEPGHYILHARSTNSEGSWTDNESTLAIDVPVTWNNSWFWSLVLGVFLLMSLVVWYVARCVARCWRRRMEYINRQAADREQQLTDSLSDKQNMVSQLQAQLDDVRQELHRTSVALDVAKASITATEEEPEAEALAIIQEPKTWGMSVAEMENMDDNDRQFLERIQDYVLNNMHNPDMEVGELADISHVSRTSFYRRLKQLSGLSPVDFIRQQRIECAKSYIVEGKSTISEVAYKVGFSDPKYFSKCFKRHVGLSPQEYKLMVIAEKQ